MLRRLLAVSRVFSARLPLEREVLAVRKQGVLLTLDVTALVAGEAVVLALAYLVERLTEVPEDMELVEQDRRLGRVLGGRVAERLPNIHHRKTDTFGRLLPEISTELIHAGFRAVRAAKPDRPLAHQVADHDAVLMALLDRQLVDPDDLRCGLAHAAQLLAHVVLVELFHRVPVQLQLGGDILDRAHPAAPSDVVGKALGVEGVLGQEIQPLALHRLTAPALYATNLDLEVHPHIAVGQVAHTPCAPVVPAKVPCTTGATERFFPRRVRRMSRARWSPKMPSMNCRARKPGKVYASESRRRRRVLAIGKSCQIFRPYACA